jgi:hypothetical protein
VCFSFYGLDFISCTPLRRSNFTRSSAIEQLVFNEGTLYLSRRRARGAQHPWSYSVAFCLEKSFKNIGKPYNFAGRPLLSLKFVFQTFLVENKF